MEAGLAALSRRRRTAFEIRGILARKGFPVREVEEAVARLIQLGYLDDLAYAAAFAGTVARSRAWGAGRIRQELARRGIPSEVIESGLVRAADEGAPPSGNAATALERLIRSRGTPRTRRERERLKAALSRRGFDPHEIARVMQGVGVGDDATGDDS